MLLVSGFDRLTAVTDASMSRMFATQSVAVTGLAALVSRSPGLGLTFPAVVDSSHGALFHTVTPNQRNTQ